MNYLIQKIDIEQQNLFKEYAQNCPENVEPLKHFFYFKGAYFAKHYKDYVERFNRGQLEIWLNAENKCLEKFFNIRQIKNKK